ncbi:MAG: hypothetical protein B7Z37_20695, partial [Verrucomicrobia bacterium 12-59-8]
MQNAMHLPQSGQGAGAQRQALGPTRPTAHGCFRKRPFGHARQLKGFFLDKTDLAGLIRRRTNVSRSS